MATRWRGWRGTPTAQMHPLYFADGRRDTGLAVPSHATARRSSNINGNSMRATSQAPTFQPAPSHLRRQLRRQLLTGLCTARAAVAARAGAQVVCAAGDVWGQEGGGDVTGRGATGRSRLPYYPNITAGTASEAPTQSHWYPCTPPSGAPALLHPAALTRVALRLQRRLGAGRRVAAVVVARRLVLAVRVAVRVRGRGVARAAAGLVELVALQSGGGGVCRYQPKLNRPQCNRARSRAGSMTTECTRWVPQLKRR